MELTLTLFENNKYYGIKKLGSGLPTELTLLLNALLWLVTCPSTSILPAKSLIYTLLEFKRIFAPHSSFSLT